MKERAKAIWKGFSDGQRRKALAYYCNLAQQVHHNCEHGGRDFGPQERCAVRRAEKEIERLKAAMADNPDSEIVRAIGADRIESLEHEIHVLLN